MTTAVFVCVTTRELVNIDGTDIPVPAVPAGWTRRPEYQPASGSPWALVTDDTGKLYWWRTELDGTDFGLPALIGGTFSAVEEDNNAGALVFTSSCLRAWTLPEFLSALEAEGVALRAGWKQRATEDDPEPTDQPIIRQTMAGYDWRGASNNFATLGDV